MIRTSAAALTLLGACAGKVDTASSSDNCLSDLSLLAGEAFRPSVVRLFFSLRDCDDGGITDATETSFTIYEDGGEISIYESDQQIIPQEAAYEIKNLLLLDMSGSIVESGNLPPLQQAATTFTDSLSEQEVAIYAFDGRENIQLIVDFTDDQPALAVAIASLGTFVVEDNSTNLNGAVIHGLNALDQAADSTDARYFAGNLITFTDGSDQAGRESNDSASAAIQSSEHSAFTVGLGGEVDSDHLLALGPDGSWTASSVDGLEDAFTQLANRIQDLANSLYLLAYCSPKRSGNHTLELRYIEDGGTTSLQFEFSAEHFEGGCVPADFLPGQGVGTTTTGSTTSGTSTPVSTTPVSVWHQLGGEDGVNAVLTSFIAYVSGDVMINWMFADADFAALSGNLYDQICEATGGNCVYKGGDMLAVHAEMAITTEQWNALIGDFALALGDNGIDYTTEGAGGTVLMETLLSMEGDIVTDPMGDQVYFNQLGGHGAIVSVVGSFLTHVDMDSRINWRFAKTDFDDLGAKMVDQVCEATGGYCTYTGLSMAEAHAGMCISAAEFGYLAEDFLFALDDNKVPYTPVTFSSGSLGDALILTLVSMRDEIVEDCSGG